MLVPSYSLNDVSDCHIRCHDSDNTSDHFALSLSMRINIPENPNASHNSCNKYTKYPCYPRAKWENKTFINSYSANLTKRLSQIPVTDIRDVDQSNAVETVNRLCDDITSSIHEAVQDSCDSTSSYNNKIYSSSSGTKRSWWSTECKTVGDRNRLYFYIWKTAGRPSCGQIYECYKYARKSYRKICRLSVKKQEQKRLNGLDELCKSGRSKQLWNKIRKSKQLRTEECNSIITLSSFEDYFSNKFKKPTMESESMRMAAVKVNERHNKLRNRNSMVFISGYWVHKYIKNLKAACAASLDGLQAEHLKYATNEMLITHLCTLMSLCLTYGVVPDSFCKGLVVPILKKSNLDPSVPQNYRPITNSSVLSKLLEMYILDQCRSYQPHKCQFGFISNRSTSMAVSIAHDINTYCIAKGSTVFTCSLDAQGAFDSLPIPVLLYKAMDTIPDPSWNILYYWYSKMSACIRWNNTIGRQISIECGTRQGGLTSPLIFNLFYEEFISDLNQLDCGITIGNSNYNVICYADDILICSLTVTGLQKLIDTAMSYTENYGLNFSAAKTTCVTYGKNYFKRPQNWTIKNEKLVMSSSMSYLGTILDSSNALKGTSHIEARIRASQKAFFSLQGAGLNSSYVSPATKMNIYTAAVRSTLVFGCSSINISIQNMKKLDRQQAKLIKCTLNLNPLELVQLLFLKP